MRNSTFKTTVKSFVLFVVIMCGSCSVAWAQLPKLADIASNAKLGGYIIGNYTYYDDEVKDQNAGFNLRLARVYVSGSIMKDWKYRLQMEVNGAPDVDKGPRIIDAYGEWVKHPEFTVRFGQMKRVFTFENPYNPWNQGFGSYAQVISKLAGFSDRVGEHGSGGRDAGVVVQGDLFPASTDNHRFLHYQVGVYNGQGVNHNDANRNKDIIGGLWVSPIKALQIGAFGWAGRYTNTNNNVKVDRNRMAFGLKYETDWTVRAEYIASEGSKSNQLYAANKADGWYTALGVPVNKQFKVYGKWDVYRDEKTSDTQTSIYGISLNYWLSTNLMFQGGYNFTTAKNAVYSSDGSRSTTENNYNMLQLQMYVRF